jgi:hypothetical protein
MIRNYQRAGGGGGDLVPIYNSITALQNGINSLLTVTELATLTNPTESGYLFTNPVLYTEPNGNALNNTYMKGVTWENYPSTATADFGNCVVYGVLSYDNVPAYNLSSCTAQTVVLNSCNSGAINGASIDNISANNIDAIALNNASFDSILLSKCNGAIVSGVTASRLCIPDCSALSIELCHINDVSIDYPSTVTRYDSNYGVTLEGNTIDKINASLLKHSVNNNSIWTANLYVDYALMQTTASAHIGFFNSNSINKISIFNNDYSLNTSNRGIYLNGLSFRENRLGHLWYDLYSPLTIDGNSVETLKNTVGGSLSANGNSVQKWNCKVSPCSMLVYLFPKNALAQIQSNTVGKWNLYHCISDDALMTDTQTSRTSALYALSINAANNSASYVTFDVLNPVTAVFDNHLYSAHLNVANRMTFCVADSIGTLNMAKNDNYVSSPLYVSVMATSARSVGATNICPRFGKTGHSIDLMNILLNDNPSSTLYSLSKLTVESLSIQNIISTTYTAGPIYINSCYIGNLNCEQISTNKLVMSSDTVVHGSVSGGYFEAVINSHRNLNINVYQADIISCKIHTLGGTAQIFNFIYNTATFGGFYYQNSSGASNTINRLNTGITV